MIEIPSILIFVLMFVESSGNPNAIGDNGKAFGALQIHEICVTDVNRIKGTGYTHQDAFNNAKAIEMFKIYTTHYAREDRVGQPVTAEHVARIWNGGPNGFKKPATDAYWRKVQAKLRELGEHDLADGKPL